jgi:hypothetical protein
MTKLLEQAIAKMRTLSEEEQNALALTIIAMADEHASAAPLDD